MSNEYVIINKTEWLKMMEELENVIEEKKIGVENERWLKHELKQTLSKSTPLIPEIEKAFDAGQFEEYKEISFDGGENYETIRVIKEKQDYITNLKLDI